MIRVQRAFDKKRPNGKLRARVVTFDRQGSVCSWDASNKAAGSAGLEELGAMTHKEREQERASVALYKAVGRYVKAYAGTVLVAGGVRVEHWPGDLTGTFYIGVRCTGTPPEPRAESSGR